MFFGIRFHQSHLLLITKYKQPVNVVRYVLAKRDTYCIIICSYFGHCHLAETVMLPYISSILFCYDFRNATPFLFCPPSLVKQKLKDLETCQDKLDKSDKQDGPQLLNSIKHNPNFTSDSSLAESCTNLFSPALKSTIKKYWIRPDNVLPNTAVFKKGIIFLNDIRWAIIFGGQKGEGFYLFIIADLKKSTSGSQCGLNQEYQFCHF